MSKDTASIRDQLGNDPDTTFVLNADYYEDIGIEEDTTVIKTRDLGNSFVLGDATNGILGTAIGSGGKQVVLGFDDRDITVKRVINPNKIFNEHFRDTDFLDTSATNTAYWDITNYRWVMSSSTDKRRTYNTVGTSSSIFYNQENVTKAKLSCDETKYGGDVIRYYLSANGGTNWEEVSRNIEHSFTNIDAEIIEYFYSLFTNADNRDDSATNTAHWDTTNHRLVMSSSTDKRATYNTIATSKKIVANSKNVTKATLNTDETKYGNDQILYYLSADGGTNWVEVTSGVEHTFSNLGTDLRYKVVFIGSGANETYISDIKIDYVTNSSDLKVRVIFIGSGANSTYIENLKVVYL